MIVLIKKKNIVDDTMKPEKETKETGPVVQAKWQHSWCSNRNTDIGKRFKNLDLKT